MLDFQLNAGRLQLNDQNVIRFWLVHRKKYQVGPATIVFLGWVSMIVNVQNFIQLRTYCLDSAVASQMVGAFGIHKPGRVFKESMQLIFISFSLSYMQGFFV